jgi:hypothetical protein
MDRLSVLGATTPHYRTELVSEPTWFIVEGLCIGVNTAGSSFVSADFAQIELRVLAHVTSMTVSNTMLP